MFEYAGIGGFILLVLDVWAIVSILSSSASTGNKVLWTLLVILLPLLEASGFEAGSNQMPSEALTTLTLMYAVLPCALRLVALGLLAGTAFDGSLQDTALKEV